jgi:hypothetical protein
VPGTLANLDPGVRRVVARLNAIDGVTTRASCEGASNSRGHNHSDLAYVAFEYPLPLRFEAYLVVALEMIGRVEEDAVYSRWPRSNGDFLDALARAAKDYRRRQRRRHSTIVRCNLSKLRSRLAVRLAAGRDVIAAACLSCRALVVSPHRCDGETRVLLRWPAGSEARWFAEFLAQPGNELDADVVAVLGSSELERRTRAGDFGAAFQRRWARYRTELTKVLLTRSLRAGVAQLRCSGVDLDVSFDEAYARLTWR